MTTQDQSRAALLPCPFCGRDAKISHSRDGEVCNVRCAGWSVGNCLGAGPNCYSEAEAIAGWNRRALPAGVELMPIAGKSHGARDGLEELLDLPDGTDVYTAAQVLTMGRVPPGWQAVPLEMSMDQLQRVASRFPFNVPYMRRLYADLLSAAARPLTAEELKDLPCPKN